MLLNEHKDSTTLRIPYVTVVKMWRRIPNAPGIAFAGAFSAT
jgi:hypothetical protein